MSPLALTGSIYHQETEFSPEQSPLQSPTFGKMKNIEQKEEEFKKLMSQKYMSNLEEFTRHDVTEWSQLSVVTWNGIFI